MKKKVLIGLTLMLVCFLVGGFYIVRSIESVTQKLEDTNAFHKVEFLRQNLEHNIKSVQADLLLQGSPHAKGFDASLKLAEEMENAARTCLDCHHEREVAQRLDRLQLHVDSYMGLLSRTLTTRANSKRLENARSQAFAEGDKLLSEVMALSVASADKISQRIRMVNLDITATKHILITCIVLGPIAVLILAAFFLKRFTGSVDTLVTATNALEHGDMNYRIDAHPLKDEFNVLARAFNGMTSALQEEQKKFASVFKMYQALFENAGDAIMITGVEKENYGKIISANQAAADMYGYSMDEILGMDIVN
ncbi:MAG: PAS domain-containing protein, partial [Desulfuromonadales bacterium]